MAEEYDRIQKRATEDPETAGDQGEENWATLLRQWLPSYPQILLDKKLYLAGGVAVAFECKTTLKAAHVKATDETAVSS